MGKMIKEGYFILIDGRDNREIEDNFSNEDAFFIFWFYLNNLCFPKAGVCKNNQGTANKEKTKKTGTENKPSIGKADKLDIGGAEKLDINEVHKPGIDIADKLSTSGVNKSGTSKKNKPSTSGAD